MINKIKWALLSVAIIMTTAVFADETIIQSGFMTDYSQLRKLDDGTADYRFTVDGVEDLVSKYNALMIDQPEVFIAADSPYRGGKPTELEALADAFRAGLTSALSEDFYIVEQSGPSVMYVRVAISNLKLKKKKRSILGYTPVGLVGGAVKGAVTTDLAKKTDLQEAVMEFELFDSETGERLIAIIDRVGDDREAPATWEELEAAAFNYGNLARCRLNNARQPLEGRADCFAEFREDEGQQ